MKLNRIFAALVLVAATASVSYADGSIDIAWTSCVGPVDLTVTGGNGVTPTAADAFVSLLGFSGTPSPADGYQVQGFGGSSGGVRDAWRFDGAGCEAGFFSTNDKSTVKACPSFSGLLGTLTIPQFEYDPTTGKIHILLAAAYPNQDANGNNQGNPGAVTPTVRYHLAQFHFDMTYATVGPTNAGAGTCGDVGVPLCLVLTQGSWLDLFGVEHQFAINRSFITANDPNNSSRCPGPVPAHSTTWGAIKGQYR